MALHIQHDFFENDDFKFHKLEEEFKEVKTSTDKVRKALFARHGELAKMYIELHMEFQTLKRDICRNR